MKIQLDSDNVPGPYLFSKCTPNFGAGQKNNLCHGPVAQVRMAPMYILVHKYNEVCLLSDFNYFLYWNIDEKNWFAVWFGEGYYNIILKICKWMSIFRVRISECRMNIRKKTKDLISFFLYHIENLYLLTYLVSLEPS